MIVRDEVVYPDAAEIRRFRAIRVLLVLLLFTVFALFRWRLSSLHDPREARLMLSAIALAVAILSGWFWLWALIVFRRVTQSGQWPYLGASVARPTTILRGERARKQAHRLLALASVLFVACVPVSAYLHFGIGARIEKLLEAQSQAMSSANKSLP